MLAAYARMCRLASGGPGRELLEMPYSSLWFVQLRGKKKRAKVKAAAPDLAGGAVDLSPFEASMRTAVDTLRATYAKIRATAATPDLLDDIAVETGGTRTPLRSVAQVAVRDGRNLFVTVFDERSVGDVERAVRGCGLNLNPVSEGRGILRIPLGKPSMERRKAMRDVAHKEGEAAKVTTRMVRRKALDEVKKVKEEFGKDEMKRLEKSVQVMTERWVEEIASMQKNKIDALLDVTRKGE